MKKTSLLHRLKSWQIILIFGILLCIIYGFGSFTFDYYAGAATPKFGDFSKYSGVGMFFVYVLSYFIILVIMLPILLIRRFGVGAAVWLPYAVSGIFVESYMEWVSTRALLGLWAAGGWCVVGLLTGFSADLAYRFLPLRWSEKWRAIVTALILGVALFLLILLAILSFYPEASGNTDANFLSIAYYGLPLLLANSAFAGYTAYIIASSP